MEIQFTVGYFLEEGESEHFVVLAEFVKLVIRICLELFWVGALAEILLLQIVVVETSVDVLCELGEDVLLETGLGLRCHFATNC